MPETDDARVVFTDGFVAAADLIVICSHLVKYADYESARVFRLMKGQWAHFDLDRKVYSICVTDKRQPTIWALGRDGRVHVKTSGPGKEEVIADAGTGGERLGYVRKIREIGGRLYVCGIAGQIYRREAKGWVHIDKGVRSQNDPEESPSLYCIDGSSEKDIYAVGQQGAIWHFNGNGWTRVESPTSQGLECVRCVSPTEVYVSGYKGALYRFDGKNWRDLSNPKLKNYFSGLEVFQGKPYVAAEGGIFAFDGERLGQVDTGLSPSPTGCRLHANDGVLWSFGLEHLCFFDGKKWTYVKHPDNL